MSEEQTAMVMSPPMLALKVATSHKLKILMSEIKTVPIIEMVDYRPRKKIPFCEELSGYLCSTVDPVTGEVNEFVKVFYHPVTESWYWVDPAPIRDEFEYAEKGSGRIEATLVKFMQVRYRQECDEILKGASYQLPAPAVEEDVKED